jgi:hypothetical protein
MRNITVSISDQTYRDIRVWCARRNTSVSHVVQTFLEDLPRLQHARRFPVPDAPPPRSVRPLMEPRASSEKPRSRIAPAEDAVKNS